MDGYGSLISVPISLTLVSARVPRKVTAAINPMPSTSTKTKATAQPIPTALPTPIVFWGPYPPCTV